MPTDKPSSIDESDQKNDADDAKLRRIARKRVGMKRGFQIHLMVFVAVNAGLLLINLQASPQVPWAQWPALGWGIGLAVHGLVTWLFLPGIGRQGDAIEREMQALRRQSRR